MHMIFFFFFSLNILTGLSQKMLCYLTTIISNISRTILNCHKKVKPILVISNRWPCHVRSFKWHLGKVLLNVIYCRETWSRIKEKDKSSYQLVVMSSSWNFPSWAELGRLRADFMNINKMQIFTPCKELSRKCPYFILLLWLKAIVINSWSVIWFYVI